MGKIGGGGLERSRSSVVLWPIRTDAAGEAPAKSADTPPVSE
jgi:hypothetical protein